MLAFKRLVSSFK